MMIRVYEVKADFSRFLHKRALSDTLAGIASKKNAQRTEAVLEVRCQVTGFGVDYCYTGHCTVRLNIG